MRKFPQLICASLAMMALAIPVAAQDKAKRPEKPNSPKAEKPVPKSDEKPAQDIIDLDAFFKKGEENAETSSCDKPAKPADPIA